MFDLGSWILHAQYVVLCPLANNHYNQYRLLAMAAWRMPRMQMC
jgi:hypothetical protein